MKKWSAFIFALFLFSQLKAQEKLITITYQYNSYGGHQSEQILKLFRGRTHFMMRKNDEVLTNDQGFTFYHYFEQTDIYTDALTRQVVQTKLYHKKYPLISSWPFQTFDWDITTETKELHGYKIQKATLSYDVTTAKNEVYKKQITAWFATELPFSAGPEGYYARRNTGTGV